MVSKSTHFRTKKGANNHEEMGAIEMGLAEEELQPLVYAWRNSNPAITMRWWDIDSCVKETVKKRITTENHGIRFMYESGEMVIIPEQAEVVKEVFAGCLAGKSTHIIAKKLNEKGVPTKKGAKWTGGTINGILTNEKYIGDALFQKTITDASFKRKRNYGEEEQYYCEDHHEPIIDRETFEKAKEAIRQRGLEKGNCTEDTSKYQNRYAMSGKIKCG